MVSFTVNALDFEASFLTQFFSSGSLHYHVMINILIQIENGKLLFKNKYTNVIVRALILGRLEKEARLLFVIENTCCIYSFNVALYSLYL